LIGITALFATNAVFFGRIRDGSCNAKISKSEADTLYWVNVVLAVIAGLLALIAIIMLFVYWKNPEYKEKYIGKYVSPTAYTAARERAVREYAGLKGAYEGAILGRRGALAPTGTPVGNLPPPAL